MLWITFWWACGFLLLFIAGRILSFVTLRSIEQKIKTNELQSGSTLRRIYKILINSAGFYYYISLPIVIVLVVAVAGVIIFTCISLGYIPIKITIILVIGVAVTVFGMVRSLFVKRGGMEPGRILEEKEAPDLYALARQVAADMGTRPIDEIRITPHTDMAVYETGSWRAKMQDKGKRILLVGTAVLKDFPLDGFRSVLAHEYGHFSHRDTAGGGVAMRVQNDMTHYYLALYHAGQATWWNVGFLFLRFYHFVFRRISAGATRLQEVLADRVAAQTYGAPAFREGLTFVIRRDIAFTTLADTEIRNAELEKRAYSNLYELTGDPGPDAEKALQNALNHVTNEEDTHPSPKDRFRYIEGVEENRPVSGQGTVSELFADWNGLTEEMTDQIRKIVEMNRQHAG
jgi:Zn-dependent protease with chaperone function